MTKAEDHPLAALDPDKCYETMMTARAELVAAKRAAEEDLVKALIQLSSAIILIVPGIFIAGDDVTIRAGTKPMLIVGAVLMVTSMLCCLLEQYHSAKAYDRQIRGVTDFYTMKRLDLPGDEHRLLKSLLFAGISSFLVGVASLSAFLIQNL